jgi:hypothetical protein
MVQKRDWTDLYTDGRRLERIIKSMDTKQANCTDESLKLAYIDRLIKTTNTKVNIVKIILNVDAIINTAKKTGVLIANQIES